MHMAFFDLNPLSIILLLSGVLFYLAGLIHYKFPPKRINYFYGYRTKRSMRNLEVWNFSQSYAAKKMQQMALYMILAGIGCNIIETGKIWSIWLGIVAIILIPIWMIIEVEKELKKRFPKN